MAAGLKAFRRSARREWRILLSSPWELALATWLPWLCLIVLALLLRQGLPRELPVAVVDEDRSARSRELLRLIDAAPAVATTPFQSLNDAWDAARSLDVYAVLYVPPDAAVTFVYYNASYPSAGTAVARDAQSALASAGRSPVVVQTTTPFNPSRSLERYLLPLIFPAILSFALCLAVVSALGRELRDRTADAWLRSARGAPLPVVLGKILPYVLLFSLYGVVSFAWLASMGTGRVEGSLLMLFAGYLLMIVAYGAIGLLLVGATKKMGESLSVTTLYAGASLAYSTITFPSEGAPMFAKVWSALLPYTTYAKLQAEQLSMRASWETSLPHIVVLTLFIVLPGVSGMCLYVKALRDPRTWGER